MTNNDELAMKLKAVAEKAGIEEWQVKRNGPGEYALMVKGSLVKHSGWSTHRPVADEVVDKKTADFIANASPANILALLAERDADKKVIAELERDVDAANARVDTKCAQLCKQDEEIEMLRLRIAELEARTVSVKLPKTIWYEHDDLARDVAVLEKRLVKKALREACAAAGIKLEVGE